MRAIQVEAFGSPVEVTRCVELAEPPPPRAGQVLLELEASPINPSDLLGIEGRYLVRARLPWVPGSEGLGRVIAVGEGVVDLEPGRRVALPLGGGTWRERMVVPATSLVPMPAAAEVADAQQLAMATVNPPTAHLLLHHVLPLARGDWVIQNAANSAVGQYLIVLARRAGFRTVNVVRRESLVAPLLKLGADVVLVDPAVGGPASGTDSGSDLAQRCKAAIVAAGGGAVRLAVDAIAGDATDRLSRCLADAGTLVNYGALSSEPCHVTAGQLLARDLRVRGLWLPRALKALPATDQRAIFADIVELVVSGALRAEVEATYPLTRITEAIAHAARPERGGKVLLTP